MSAPLDFRSTSEQKASEPYADERDGSTTAPHSPIILPGVGPHATNLVPTPPNKQPKSSWLWRHGEAVTDLKDDLNKWLCRICYEEPSQSLVRSRDGEHRDGNVAVMMIKSQKRSQEEVFDREGCKRTYLEWLLSSNQSLRQASGDKIKALISFRNPIVEPLVPQSHHTPRDWIVEAFTAAKPMVIESLQMARSTITVSFDHWLAENELDLLGVVAHYLDSNLELKTVLLALKPSHDNAANNDAALRLLSRHIDVKPARQRLRCSGHVINLVVKAMLYGVDSEYMLDAALSEADHRGDSELFDTSTVSKFEAVLRSKDESSRLDAWRKKGPIGKLHNLVVHVKSGSARRRFFEAKQGGDVHTVVSGDRERRGEVELRFGTDRLDSRDCLSADDWQELTDLLKLLRPMKEASLKVQAVAKDGQNGALWQSLACVNLGWKKLDKYYALSDATPAYRLAIFLHPCFKRRWFERHWMGKTAWLESADEVMKRAWQYAKRRWPNEVTMSSPKQQEMDAFDAYNHDIDDDTDNDELARYLREERAPQGTRPLTWWREHHHRFLLPRHSRSRSSQRLQALAPTSESFRWLETSLTKSDQTQWRSWRRFTRVYAAVNRAYADQAGAVFSNMWDDVNVAGVMALAFTAEVCTGYLQCENSDGSHCCTKSWEHLPPSLAHYSAQEVSIGRLSAPVSTSEIDGLISWEATIEEFFAV
ncbi:hypothetical protein Q7P35_008224 [Cladosporium inversicolor]